MKITSFVVLLSTLLMSQNVWSAGGHDDHTTEAEPARGPHGGRLMQDGDLRLELSIFESGVPAEYRAWIWRNGEKVAPNQAQLEVKLHRLGGQTDRIPFAAQGDFLRGQKTIAEPHSFDVEIKLQVGEETAQWDFESHEGRVHIEPEMANQLGIETAIAGSGTLEIRRSLTGRVHVNPARVARVRARYPGLIEGVNAEPWTQVKKGQTLARVQSNDSLQSYAVTAPIAGWVVKRAAQTGEVTGDMPLFVITDLSELWVELDVFDHDLDAVKVGQPVSLFGLHGEALAQGRIEQLSPLAIHTAQSVRARVVIANPDGVLRPGQYVRGEVIVERKPSDLIVPKAALQSFRDFTVVYQKINNDYEVRMLQLGLEDATQVEVLGGLEAGARIVTRNSYLLKADIEKSGASHDH